MMRREPKRVFDYESAKAVLQEFGLQRVSGRKIKVPGLSGKWSDDKTQFRASANIIHPQLPELIKLRLVINVPADEKEKARNAVTGHYTLVFKHAIDQLSFANRPTNLTKIVSRMREDGSNEVVSETEDDFLKLVDESGKQKGAVGTNFIHTADQDWIVNKVRLKFRDKTMFH